LRALNENAATAQLKTKLLEEAAQHEEGAEEVEALKRGA
jgi:hypothetical protein